GHRLGEPDQRPVVGQRGLVEGLGHVDVGDRVGLGRGDVHRAVPDEHVTGAVADGAVGGGEDDVVLDQGTAAVVVGRFGGVRQRHHPRVLAGGGRSAAYDVGAGVVPGR